MTKRELNDLTADFDDSQDVYIRLHTKRYPRGIHLFIQEVHCQPLPEALKESDILPQIALVAHENNADVRAVKKCPKCGSDDFNAMHFNRILCNTCKKFSMRYSLVELTAYHAEETSDKTSTETSACEPATAENWLF